MTVALVASILFGQIGFVFAGGNEVMSIQVDIKKSHEEFSIERTSLFAGMRGYFEHNVFQGKVHHGRIISGEGKVLGYFSAREMNAVACSDGSPNRGCNDLEEAEIEMKVPLIPNGKKAEIFDPQGKKILTIDLSRW